MKVLTGEGISKLVERYVSGRLGVNLGQTPFVGFGVFTEDGSFVAGVVVSNYRGSDCEVSMAAETANWAKKGIMRIIFEYIFYRTNCTRCTCVVPNKTPSKRTRRFLEGVGFVLEGNMRRAYDGETDALIYGLLRQECRFLAEFKEVSRGEKERTSSASSAGPLRHSSGPITVQ
jgi:hypothetical protein